MEAVTVVVMCFYDDSKQPPARDTLLSLSLSLSLAVRQLLLLRKWFAVELEFTSGRQMR